MDCAAAKMVAFSPGDEPIKGETRVEFGLRQIGAMRAGDLLVQRRDRIIAILLRQQPEQRHIVVAVADRFGGCRFVHFKAKLDTASIHITQHPAHVAVQPVL